MSPNFKDKNHLEELFDTYYDKVYGFLYARTVNKAITEDLTSQTFLKVVEKYHTYNQEKGAASTWIFTIALNEFRSYYRSQKGKESVNLDDLTELQSDMNTEKSVYAYENQKMIFTLLNDLDERQRNIITLKYYGDFSNKEIAAILEISETNASTILARTLKKIKIMLEQCDEITDFAYKG